MYRGRTKLNTVTFTFKTAPRLAVSNGYVLDFFAYIGKKNPPEQRREVCATADNKALQFKTENLKIT